MTSMLYKMFHIEEVIKFFSWDFLVLLFNKGIYILIILVIGELILKLVSFMIKRTLRTRFKILFRTVNADKTTIERLAINAVTYIIRITLLIIILSIVGINVRAVLAGAGVLGLILGLGMQSLIKDVVSGIFIIFEGQFSVGDKISINSSLFEGYVEEIGIRTTKLVNDSNETFIIPNGNITSVLCVGKEEKLEVGEK